MSSNPGSARVDKILIGPFVSLLYIAGLQTVRRLESCEQRRLRQAILDDNDILHKIGVLGVTASDIHQIIVGWGFEPGPAQVRVLYETSRHQVLYFSELHLAELLTDCLLRTGSN
ncbi:unnamed protein product [Hymenolepis diminuta]|uniref:Uncharacterized protein n=1 Tax=Hymenolepis diminuta TaxID=6216 RepID=A0A564Y5F3_HYMDI|nr:unnamed protein product [Hymenolepis diminuta]